MPQSNASHGADEHDVPVHVHPEYCAHASRETNEAHEPTGGRWQLGTAGAPVGAFVLRTVGCGVGLVGAGVGGVGRFVGAANVGPRLVGACDGLRVRGAVGDLVGRVGLGVRGTGSLVGAAERGCFVGLKVGEGLGRLVGDLVSLGGSCTGLSVGMGVGLSVGKGVGLRGADVGRFVGGVHGVGATVGRAVGSLSSSPSLPRPPPDATGLVDGDRELRVPGTHASEGLHCAGLVPYLGVHVHAVKTLHSPGNVASRHLLGVLGAKQVSPGLHLAKHAAPSHAHPDSAAEHRARSVKDWHASWSRSHEEDEPAVVAPSSLVLVFCCRRRRRLALVVERGEGEARSRSNKATTRRSTVTTRRGRDAHRVGVTRRVLPSRLRSRGGCCIVAVVASWVQGRDAPGSRARSSSSSNSSSNDDGGRRLPLPPQFSLGSLLGAAARVPLRPRASASRHRRGGSSRQRTVQQRPARADKEEE